MPSSANNNNGNYIKLFRKFQKWGWYNDPATKSVFLHLLLNANWQDGEFRGEKIRAGEVVFGRKKAAEALGLSERQVRTALDHLKKSGEISTTKTTNRFSIIKIEKWAFYQSGEDASDQQTRQQATSKRPASDHIQEEKEGKKKKRNIYNVPSFEAATVITHLNQKTGKSFRVQAKSNQEHIDARIADGYQVSDLIAVIDNMVPRWMGDPKMEQFLNPTTLFRPKNFEKYLNAAAPKKEKDQEEDPWSTWLG